MPIGAAAKTFGAKTFGAKTAEAKPVEAEATPVEATAVEATPVEDKPVDAKPVEVKPIEVKEPKVEVEEKKAPVDEHEHLELKEDDTLSIHASEAGTIATPEIDETLLEDFYDTDGDNSEICIAKFVFGLQKRGLKPLTDPRFKSIINKLKSFNKGDEAGTMPEYISQDDFKKCLASNMVFIQQALSDNLVIPDWKGFTDIITEVFNECREGDSGQVASLTSQLRSVNADNWGISICTVDGQRFNLGSYEAKFPILDLNRVILYCLTCSEKSVDYVHKYIGKEPSGGSAEALALKDKKPHNPLLLTGGVTMTSLMKPNMCFSERFEYFLNKVQGFAGNDYIGFNNSLSLALKDHSNRLYAIGHYLKTNDCLNKDDPVQLEELTELCIHFSSIEATSSSVSVMAATLAQGGICPLTGEKVAKAEAVRNCLSMMNCCGVNDYSGEFMFEVGLPAKSNQSGALMLVIPNVLGMCIYSPRLDRSLNSTRAIKFCKKFTSKFTFHQFEPTLQNSQTDKIDPRRMNFSESKEQQNLTLLFASYRGKMTTLYRYLKEGVNFDFPDYDGRTAIHLAVCGGQFEVTKFLLEKASVEVNPLDRWNSTPLDDALKYEYKEIIDYLLIHEAKRGSEIAPVQA